MAFAICACEKHDPILSGVRNSIFNTDVINVLNTPVQNAPENIQYEGTKPCPYVQKSDNTVWAENDKKIFSGFATNNSVDGVRTPVCSGGFVYAGLTTGELVKINPKTRSVEWVADVYRQSNMTGGASVLDIVAPIQIQNGYVYAGGLGGAFCKMSDKTGATKWCINIGTGHPFIISTDVAWLVDTENYLNAVRLRDGAIYWRTKIKKAGIPVYQDKVITIESTRLDAESGAVL